MPRKPDETNRPETKRTEGNMFEAINRLRAQEKERRLSEDFEGDVYEPKAYRYFHPEKYENGLALAKKVQADAKQIIKDGKYDPLRVSLGYMSSGPDAKLVGEAVLFSDTGYFGWRARLLFGTDKLLHSECTSCYHRFNGSSYLKHDMCKHELAALYLLKEYLDVNVIGDWTNGQALTVMNAALRRGSGSALLGESDTAAAHAEKIIITPVLEVEDRYLYLSFKIGTGKMFKVAKIEDTVEHFRKCEEQTFGKSTVIRLDKNLVDEDSLKWLDFMESAVEEDAQMHRRLNRRRSYYYSEITIPSMGGRIELSGIKLDQFYEMMQGRTIEAVFKTTAARSKKNIQVKRGTISIVLTLGPMYGQNGTEFQGAVLAGEMPQLMRGRDGLYFFDDDNNLIRAQDMDMTSLNSLIEAGSSGRINMKIGRNHLADFYHKVLPQLKRCAEILETDPDLIARFIPPDVQFIFYFDVIDGRIICQPMAYYGQLAFFVTDWINDGPTDPAGNFRDRITEEQVLNKLHEYIDTYDADNHVLICDNSDDAAFDLLDRGLTELMQIGEVHATDRFRALKVRKNVAFSMGVRIESDLMNLSINSPDLSDEELLDILFGYREKRRFVRLKNGDFLKIDPEEAQAKLARMMEELHVTPAQFVRGKMSIPAYRALYLDKMLEQDQEIYVEKDRHYKQLVKEFRTVEDSDFDVPASLSHVLRRYQEAGYRWIRMLDRYGFGGILADEMGLGKTLQMIAVLYALCEEAKEAQNAKKITSLVVCPASLVFNWGEEFARFAPSMKVCLVTGTAKERSSRISQWNDYDVLVTSYDLLKRDIDQYEGKTFRCAVIDEAQNIKNNSTAAAKSVKLISASSRFALTGTPIENRLSELWSIFDFIMPGYLFDYPDFRTDVEVPIVKQQDEEKSAMLGRMVSPFILRRLKKDVLRDLPDKLEQIRYARMEKKQQRLYDGQVVKMRQTISSASEEEFRKSRIQILAELTRIRQICCNPSLLYADYDGDSAKTDLCMELVRDLIAGEHRALIFSQFTSMLAILESELKKEGIEYYKITGETPKEKRLELVNAFNKGNVPIFLISLKAGGTGLNLTGADVVIHYDPWWNLAVQNQATDRAHRIGQTRVVNVYKLIIKDSIEEKIIELQESKKKLAEDILGGEQIGSTTFDRDELLKLLQ